MRETRRAPQDEPTDGLDDLGLDLYDPDDLRYQQTPPPQPHILLQTGHWDSHGYSANSFGNTYGSSYAHYDNNPPDYSSWPPLDNFQALSLDQQSLPESSAQYNLNATNPAFSQYAPYRNATLSPQDAIPASFQAQFGDYHYPNVSSAPPTLAQEGISASSHFPLTPKGPSTVKSSESSKRYSCDRCPQRFKQRKDLDRHTPIHTRVPDGQKIKGRYLCWCGKVDHRKDNHWRHVDKCKKNGINNFVCQCGFETSSKQQHKDHIRGCREGCNPVGRPARSRATPSVASWED